MIKTILFASDFTGLTQRAEEYARSIAKAMEAHVTLIHAVESIDDPSDSIQDFLEAKKAEAAARSEEIAARFRQEGIACDTRVEIGKRWKVIVDTATEGKFDLVILGSHKIHDGDKVYLGTTTHKVFFAAELPLLVVPSE